MEVKIRKIKNDFKKATATDSESIIWNRQNRLLRVLNKMKIVLMRNCSAFYKNRGEGNDNLSDAVDVFNFLHELKRNSFIFLLFFPYVYKFYSLNDMLCCAVNIYEH